MRKIILFLSLFLVSFTASSQLNEDNPIYKFYLEKAKENTIESLSQYKGNHITNSVDEYEFIGNKWQFIKSDTTASEINYFDFYLTFKRSDFKAPLIRYLVLEGYNEKDNYYMYSSYYGYVCIYSDFKTVVLFDKPDETNKPTKKYIFNF